MPADDTFLVEDFLQAITSQLDRTQDALVVKAVTRPLTYALREFSMELHVFVELDGEGNVRFRNSSPNEVGASSVQLAFTTITRPMIAENTISLAMTRSPNLEELGLAAPERRRLEQLGVRNAAQLQRLGSSAGASAVSRLSGVSLDRLREALELGRPRVTGVAPVPPPPPPPEPRPPSGGTTPPPGGNGSGGGGGTRPPFPGRPWREVAIDPPFHDRVSDVTRPDRPPSLPRPEMTLPPRQEVAPVAPSPADSLPPPFRPATPLPVRPDATRLRLSGVNLIGEDGPPAVRLNRRLLPLTQADDSEIEVELEGGPENGRLEVELPSGEILAYDLSVEGSTTRALTADEFAETPLEPVEPFAEEYPLAGDDPWSREAEQT